MERIQSGETVDLGQVSAFIEWLRREAGFPGFVAERFGKVSNISVDENARSYAEAIASRLGASREHARSTRQSDEIATI